jgi:hypothetical protein
VSQVGTLLVIGKSQVMMTKREFEEAIRRLVRRTRLLREAAAGTVKLRAVDVKQCEVPAHTRCAHTRMIAPKGWRRAQREAGES